MSYLDKHEQDVVRKGARDGAKQSAINSAYELVEAHEGDTSKFTSQEYEELKTKIPSESARRVALATAKKLWEWNNEKKISS